MRCFLTEFDASPICQGRQMKPSPGNIVVIVIVTITIIVVLIIITIIITIMIINIIIIIIIRARPDDCNWKPLTIDTWDAFSVYPLSSWTPEGGRLRAGCWRWWTSPSASPSAHAAPSESVVSTPATPRHDHHRLRHILLTGDRYHHCYDHFIVIMVW